ncbi:MAG: hypothetical protein LC109_00305 [Bacteroidia bacterium]|nr:hypothetical protein [Bacteroidia bacterium]
MTAKNTTDDKNGSSQQGFGVRRGLVLRMTVFAKFGIDSSFEVYGKKSRPNAKP